VCDKLKDVNNVVICLAYIGNCKMLKDGPVCINNVLIMHLKN